MKRRTREARTAPRLLLLVGLLVAARPALTQPAAPQSPRQLGDELYRVLVAQGLDAALRRHEEIRQSPAEGYDQAEPQLNRLGYRLLGEGRVEEAIAFLRLNSELFSASANARDSLAEAYLLADLPAEAARQYEAVLETLARSEQPASPTAQYLERRAREALGAFAAASTRSPAGPAPTGESSEARSPRIRRLAIEVANQGAAAVDAFQEEVRLHGAPLVEALPDAERGVLVTFLWFADRDEPGEIVVESPFEARYVERRVMERLAGTRLWFKTFEAPPGLRAGYLISPRDRRFGAYAAMYTDSLVEAGWRLDPWNPRRERGEGNRDWSLLELPGARAAPWLDDEPVALEALHELALPDADLGRDRTVVVYAPVQDGPVPADLPLVIFLDGFAMLEIERADRMLARMMRAGELPPVVAAFVHSPEDRRNRELSCHAPMHRFLADQLIPVLRQRFGAGRDPLQTVLVGRSRSGLGAVCAAFQRPDAIGKAVAQSGSFWWAPDGEETEWLARQVAGAECRPIEVVLQVGSLEGSPSPSNGLSLLTASRHLRDVMRARGYGIHYREFAGGHDPTAWRVELPGALAAIHFGKAGCG